MAKTGFLNSSILSNSILKETTMSALRGDTSRHHRLRKKKIRNRAKIRDLKKQLEAAAAAPAAAEAKK